MRYNAWKGLGALGRLIITLSVIQCGCIQSDKSDETQAMNDVRIVQDTTKDMLDRVAAIQRLPESERVQLRESLAKNLPGNWDKETLNSIELLGEIGDKSSIAVLKSIINTRHEGSGKFAQYATAAIAQIETRHK